MFQAARSGFLRSCHALSTELVDFTPLAVVIHHRSQLAIQLQQAERA
jgi:hypothetical protein